MDRGAPARRGAPNRFCTSRSLGDQRADERAELGPHPVRVGVVEVLQDGQSVPPSGPPTITDRSTPSSDRSPATCTRTCSAAAGGCESHNTSTISAWDTSRPGCSASNPSSARGMAPAPTAPRRPGAPPAVPTHPPTTHRRRVHPAPPSTGAATTPAAGPLHARWPAPTARSTRSAWPAPPASTRVAAGDAVPPHPAPAQASMIPAGTHAAQAVTAETAAGSPVPGRAAGRPDHRRPCG